MSGHLIAAHLANDAMRSQFEPAPPKRPRRRRQAVVRPAAASVLRAVADRLEPVPQVRQA